MSVRTLILSSAALSCSLLGLALLCGCPQKPSGQQTAETAISEGLTPATPDASVPAPPPTTEQAAPPPVKPIPPTPAEPISDATRKEFAEQTAIVERQVAALNAGDVDAYTALLAADAPRRESLLQEFQQFTGAGIVHELHSFKPKPVTDGWVKGVGVVISKAGDGTATRYTFDYTMKRVDETWQIHDIVAMGSEKLGP